MSSLHFLDAPVIQQEQTNIKTVAGEEIHITCTVEAEPAPALTWTRNGARLEEEVVDPIREPPAPLLEQLLNKTER